MMNNSKKLVLGIGNEILKDDSIGLRLCDHLASKNTGEGLRFQKASLGGLELLDQIQDVDALLILDAIKTSKGEPGDVYLLETNDLKQPSHISNVHNVDFVTALETGSILGMRLPQKIWIIAVEIVEDMEFGTDLTPSLQAKYEDIVYQVESIFNSFMKYELHPSLQLS